MKKLFLLIVFTIFHAYSYSQQINFEWNKIIGNTGQTAGLSIKCDSLGYVYASGTFEGIISYNGAIFNSDTGQDGYLFKLDTLGNLIWSKQFSSNYNVKIHSITIDENNNVIVLGNYRVRVDFDVILNTNNTDTIYSSNMFISKYDPNGNLLWAKNTGGVAYDGNSVAVDSNNDILITGKSVDVIYFDTIASVTTLDSTYYTYPAPHWVFTQPEMGFIAKYDQNGNKIWIKKTDGNPQEIISDRNNNIIVTGNFGNNITSFDGFAISPIGFETSYLAKYTSSGSLNWVKISGGSANWNSGYGLAVDTANNIYQSGQLMGNDVEFEGNIVSIFEGTDAYLSKYDKLGNLIWYHIIGSLKTMADEQDNFNRGCALIIDNKGDILLLGYFSDTLTFDTTNLRSNGAPDLLLIKYNSSGTVLVSAQFSDYGWVGGNGLSIDKNNDIYLTGFTTLSSWDSRLPSYAFIGKIKEPIPTSPLNIRENSDSYKMLIYPNPSKGIIHLEFSDIKDQKLIEIFSIDGKKIKEIISTESNISFEINKSGFYLVLIQIDDKIISRKIVVE